MHKFVKWGLVGLSIPIGSLLLGATWLNLNISQRLAKDYNTTTVHWNHSEAGDLQIGERIVRVRNGCIDCHGNNLAGAKIMDNPAMGKMYGSNLTPASLKDWSDTEIARAIRHGIGRDGKPLVLMPSHDYINFSESDLKAVIAYLRSIPAVTQDNGPIALGPVAKVLLVTGKAATLVPAEIINHQQPFLNKPAEAPTIAFGKYLAQTACIGCHGPELKGGPIPGGPPDWPEASNLTQQNLGPWNKEAFVTAMRKGTTPDGRTLRAPMPIPLTAKMDDTELNALWLYLKTL
jgi:mono/diheme cytochrome c family protein